MIKPSISIIIPVYKAENVLSRCVESVLAQTYKNWELILIDDGSPDNSGLICDNLSSNEMGIKTYHKSNGGVSSARNLGIEKATGEYITFVDADDYVEPEFLEKMVACCPADLIVCGFNNIGEDSFCPEEEILNLKENREAIEKLINIPYYTDAPWCKLFKRKIIEENKLQFDLGLRLCEDTLFCYEYLSFCKCVKTISKPLYVYDGLWGGDSKYELTYTELQYASKRVVNSINNLNKVFNSRIETKYKCWHLSKLKGLFVDYTDKDTYELYVSTHKYIPYQDYIGDGRLSPLTVGLLKASLLARSGKKNECSVLLDQIEKFITEPINNYPSVKQKFLFRFLTIFGANITTSLLRLIK